MLNNDSTVRVYRLPTGDLLGSYTSTGGFPLAAAFTADGRRLAVTKDTGQLAVIDLARLADDPADAVVWTKAAHTGSVTNVVTSASGLIATRRIYAGTCGCGPLDGTLVADLPVQPEAAPRWRSPPAPTPCTTKTPAGSSGASPSIPMN